MWKLLAKNKWSQQKRNLHPMQHIVFNCKAKQNSLGNCKAPMFKNIPWPTDFNITTIMALPLLKIHSLKGHICHGATHLSLIIISKCAFLIWKLRCTRILDIMPDKPLRHISLLEAHNKTTAIINSRLNQDKLTSSKRYGQ